MRRLSASDAVVSRFDRRHWLGRMLTIGGAAVSAATLPGCALLASPEAEEQQEPARGGTAISSDDLSDSAWAQASPLVDTHRRWLHLRFRGRKPSHYEPQWHQGRPALHALSQQGSSVVRQQMLRPASTPSRLAFSWWADALPPVFDVRASDADDAVARVIVTFDGDRSRFTPRDAMLSELGLLLTGEPLPSATIEYVWDTNLPAGTVLTSHYSTRVRYIVAQSGTDRLSQWVDIERDLQADFALAFDEAPAAITAIGLMTDANNTLGEAQAWFGPMRWAR